MKAYFRKIFWGRLPRPPFIEKQFPPNSLIVDKGQAMKRCAAYYYIEQPFRDYEEYISIAFI